MESESNNEKWLHVAVVNDKDSYIKTILEKGGGEKISVSSIPRRSVKKTHDQINSLSPDLVVVCLSGSRCLKDIALCRQLKLDQNTRAIPVVFVQRDKECDVFGNTAFIYGCIDLIDSDTEEKDILSRLKYYISMGRVEKGIRGLLEKLDAI